MKEIIEHLVNEYEDILKPILIIFIIFGSAILIACMFKLALILLS